MKYICNYLKCNIVYKYFVLFLVKAGNDFTICCVQKLLAL